MPIDKEKIEDAFETTKARHAKLRHADIALRFNKGLFFTMQAGIEFRSFFTKKRKYYINVNPRRKKILSGLSKEDLIGWFGHEFGHIMDYETMSRSKLLVFILRYIFDLKFRFSVEKKINVLASNNGFFKELFGVWKKFISMNTVSKKYRRYITRHYFPDWESIKGPAQDEGISREVYESFKQERVDFPEKTLRALRWITEILERHSIDYEILGGFAAKIYGSSRELNDIDIDISEKYFPVILPEISEYITYGPARYQDGKWDLEVITLDYHGQEIDIGGTDTARISNKERTEWIAYSVSPFSPIDVEVGGRKVKVFHPRKLINYKKELDGDHQLVDITAAERYMVQNSLG